jgi:hypothetical protein
MKCKVEVEKIGMEVRVHCENDDGKRLDIRAIYLTVREARELGGALCDVADSIQLKETIKLSLD